MSIYEGMNMKVINSICNNNNASRSLNKDFLIEEVGKQENKIIYYYDYLNAFFAEEVKIILDDTFLQKFKEEKITVNCETEKEAEEFCKWMNKNGLIWSGGSSDNIIMWDYNKDTCYVYNFNSNSDKRCVSSKEFWRGNKYTIIKYSDLINIKKEEQKMSFKKDDKVRYIGEDWLGLKQGKIYTVDYLNFDDTIQLEGIVGDLHPETFELVKNDIQDSYKILKSFTLQDIIDAKPCNVHGELWKLMDEFRDRNLRYDYTIDSWNKFKSFKITTEYKSWFIEKGFIEKCKPEFKPFDLNIKIESFDMLLELKNKLNLDHDEYEELCKKRDMKYTGKKYQMRLFDPVSDKYKQIKKDYV